MTRVDEEVLKEIKRIIIEEAGKLGIKVDRVILFGSRARGDYREDSDWDILVVVGGGLDWRTKRRLSSRVRVRSLKSLGISLDIIITTRDRWMAYQEQLGHLYYRVRREGIPV